MCVLQTSATIRGARMIFRAQLACMAWCLFMTQSDSRRKSWETTFFFNRHHPWNHPTRSCPWTSPTHSWRFYPFQTWNRYAVLYVVALRAHSNTEIQTPVYLRDPLSFSQIVLKPSFMVRVSPQRGRMPLISAVWVPRAIFCCPFPRYGTMGRHQAFQNTITERI